MNREFIGKILIAAGILIVVSGLLFWLGKGLNIGRLPGDIVYENKNVKIYIPIVTSILISIILTIIINLFIRR